MWSDGLTCFDHPSLYIKSITLCPVTAYNPDLYIQSWGNSSSTRWLPRKKLVVVPSRRWMAIALLLSIFTFLHLFVFLCERVRSRYACYIFECYISQTPCHADKLQCKQFKGGQMYFDSQFQRFQSAGGKMTEQCSWSGSQQASGESKALDKMPHSVIICPAPASEPRACHLQLPCRVSRASLESTAS